jgi:sulfur-carrier protein
MLRQIARIFSKARTDVMSAPLPYPGRRATLGDAMQITIKLYATFRVGRFAAITREYPPGTTIVDIVRELAIPEEQLGVIMLNSRHAQPKQALNDGDNLALFPLVGGG